MNGAQKTLAVVGALTTWIAGALAIGRAVGLGWTAYAAIGKKRSILQPDIRDLF